MKLANLATRSGMLVSNYSTCMLAWAVYNFLYLKIYKTNMAQFTLKSIKKSMKPRQAHVHYIYTCIWPIKPKITSDILRGGGSLPTLCI